MKTYNAESGRSMIEMLGVLAIIGVLSVGGIAGYSKAMMKYRINKTIEQVTLIGGNIRSFFGPQRSYFDAGDSEVWRKAKLIPDEMWDNVRVWPVDLWGGDVDIQKSYGGSKEGFEIYYDGDSSEEECIELVTHDWKTAGVKMIRVWASGCPDCHFIPPASLDDAIKLCNKEDDNDLEMHYYFEINTDEAYWKNKIESTKANLAN